MKKGILAFAVMALGMPLCAQMEQESFSKAEILDIFAQLNPSVLERAEQDSQYNAILQEFLNSYQASPSPTSRYELMAVARNFDNSIKLQSLAETYYAQWQWAQMTGAQVVPGRQQFVYDVTDVMENIWAVTVSLREYQLDEAKAQLKKTRTDKTLDTHVRQEEEKRLKEEIKSLRAELKTLRKNPGQYVLSAAEDYAGRAEANFSVLSKTAQNRAQAARQSRNLQIKTNNKKPVAK